MSDDERPSLSQRISQLTVLHQISREIAASLHLDQILAQATTLVRKYYGYDHVAYFTLDKERGEVVLEARSSIFEEKLPSQNRQKIKTGMLGWVVQNKQSLLVNDVSADPRYTNPFPDILATQSELTAPVIAGDTLIGVLDIQSTQPQAFDETDVIILETLAGQLAVAIENARLRQKVQLELTGRIRSTRKQAERALREREERFRGLAESASDAIITITADSTIRFFNPAAERIFGFTAAEALGANLDIIIPEEYGQRHQQAIERYLQTRVPRILGQTIEIRGQRKNGEIFPIELSLSQSQVEGEIIFTGIIRDITERKLAEEHLGEARLKAVAQLNELNHIYDQVSEGLGFLDTEMRFVRLNERLAAINGFSVGDHLGKTLREMSPLLADQLEPVWPDILATGKEIRFETAVPDSGRDWVVKYKPSLGAERDVAGVSVMVLDVTDLKRAEREAQNRAYQQEIIANLSQQALSGLALPWLMDQVVNLTAVTLDVEYCKILELLPGEEELLLKAGAGWQNGLVGHVTVGVEMESQAGYTLISEGPVIVHDLAAETRFSGPDLLIEHGVVSGVSVIIPGDGRPYGIFGIHSTQSREFTRNDVNFIQAVANILAVAIQRQQTEDILVESEARLRKIFQTVPIGVGMTQGRRIMFANPAICQMLGYEEAELVGREARILYPNDAEFIRVGEEKMPQVVSEGTAAIETKFAAKDGRILDILLTATLIDPDDPTAGIIATALDISERKKLEAAQKAYAEALETAVSRRTQQLQDAQAAQLVQHEKMAALSQLAAAVAHELRNPLTAVKNAAYLLKEAASLPQTEIQETVTILDEEMARAEYIIRQLLDYTQAKPPIPRKVQLNQLISSVLSDMDWARGVELTTQLDDSLPLILADPGQLRQAFTNVIENGLQAMPDGGQLGIQSVMEDGRWAVITVTDTGEGIPEHEQSRLFEPLFTTRTRGIGLGLPLVKKIIDAHQGLIQLQSKPGKGTKIKVKLPLAVQIAADDQVT